MMDASGLRVSVREIIYLIVISIGAIYWAIGFWGSASAWKVTIEDHLNRIDDHLHSEDQNILDTNRKIQWLIDHAQENNMKMKQKRPHAMSIPPLFADKNLLPQDSGLNHSGYRSNR